MEGVVQRMSLRASPGAGAACRQDCAWPEQSEAHMVNVSVGQGGKPGRLHPEVGVIPGPRMRRGERWRDSIVLAAHRGGVRGPDTRNPAALGNRGSRPRLASAGPP